MASVKDVGTGNIQYLSFGYDADNNPTTITDNVTTANNQTLTYDAIDRLKSAPQAVTARSVRSPTTRTRTARPMAATSYTVPSTSDKMSAVGGDLHHLQLDRQHDGRRHDPHHDLQQGQPDGLDDRLRHDDQLHLWRGRLPPDRNDGRQPHGRSTDTARPACSCPKAAAPKPITPTSTASPSPPSSPRHLDGQRHPHGQSRHPEEGDQRKKTVVWNMVMTPNGAGTISPNSITQSLRWPGQHNDGVSYFEQRLPHLPAEGVGGRYVEADPIGLAGGLNPYVYAGNNPYVNVDPLGLCPPQYANDCIDESYGAELAGAALASEAPTVISLFNWIATLSQSTPGNLTPESTAAPKPPAAEPGAQCKAPQELPSQTGDLTPEEINQIQSAVDEAGRPLDVVGSAAEGARRGVGTELPIGKGPGTQSDIDYTTANSHIGNFQGIEGRLPNADPETPILRGTADPNQGPSIRFEPGLPPKFIPKN